MNAGATHVLQSIESLVKGWRETGWNGTGVTAFPRAFLAGLLLSCAVVPGCRAEPQKSPRQSAPTAAAVPTQSIRPETTGGFDGQRAMAHVEQLVALGPRPPGSEGIRRAQQYIRAQLESYGCAVTEDDFHASTPAGRVAMKNLVAKLPGQRSDVLLLLTHYDTKRIPDFVGANDGGSSTGVMLELARLLCGEKNALTIWIAFLDGEEAFSEWSETDGAYGSRQLAAKLAVAGELKRIRAVILADLVGDRELNFRRESNSTPWLTDLVWATAARLGYQKHFLPEATAIEDDHIAFLRRGVPAVDIIDLDYVHWHTPADRLDKISPHSLGVVGHVILEVISELKKKFR